MEAIFDIGRHILSKSGATELVGEFKGIARGLVECGVVDDKLGRTLVQMAGYRNRLAQLYYQVTEPELYAIISSNLADLHAFVKAVRDYAAERRSDGGG